MAKATLDMTQGSALPLLLRFALPTLAGNLLHQVYTLTDSIIVGRYLGETPLGAVGCTTPIIMLLAALMIGVNIAVGILIGQCYGCKDENGIRRAFISSLYLGAIISVVMAVTGAAASELLLRWMGTPEGALVDAAAYLRINFMTTVCPLLYYLFSSVFRGMGDSRTALYCLIVSVVANVGLDILFVAVWDWGVAGSAWATALAQGLSALFAAILLWKRFPTLRPRVEELMPDLKQLRHITGLAVPIALQTAFNNLGNVVAQRAVNGFGEAVMAAYTAAGRLGTLSLMPVETIGSAMSVYAGQNHGANKPDRIRQGVRAGLLLAAIASTVLGAVLLFGSNWLTTLFLKKPSSQVLVAARRYLLIAAVPGVLAGVMHVFQQTLRGVDKPNHAMVGGLMQLGVKIAVIAWGAWLLKNLDIVWLAWPLSFVAGTVWPAWVYYKHFAVLNKDESDLSTAQ